MLGLCMFKTGHCFSLHRKLTVGESLFYWDRACCSPFDSTGAILMMGYRVMGLWDYGAMGVRGNGNMGVRGKCFKAALQYTELCLRGRLPLVTSMIHVY